MKSCTSTAFTFIWAFELAILMSPTACSWVPWCGSHKIWYLGMGFVGALVLTLINFADRLSSRQPSQDDGDEAQGGKGSTEPKGPAA